MREMDTALDAGWRPAVGQRVQVDGVVVERPGMVAEPSLIDGVWVEFDLAVGGPALTIRWFVPLRALSPPPTGPPSSPDPLT